MYIIIVVCLGAKKSIEKHAFGTEAKLIGFV